MKRKSINPAHYHDIWIRRWIQIENTAPIKTWFLNKFVFWWWFMATFLTSSTLLLWGWSVLLIFFLQQWIIFIVDLTKSMFLPQSKEEHWEEEPRAGKQVHRRTGRADIRKHQRHGRPQRQARQMCHPQRDSEADPPDQGARWGSAGHHSVAL